jgi:hypothetical protein
VGRKIKEEELCPRIDTDWHGLKRGGIGLGVMGYAVLPSSYQAVWLSGMKKRSAVPAD